MAKQDRQPAAISPDLITEPGYYRASMHLELQKFGNSKRARQLLLSEAVPADGAGLESRIQEFGLDLSVSELRAMYALLVSLERTGYKGNAPGEWVHSEAFWFDGYLPRLIITFAEYLEAYGVQKGPSGRWNRTQRDEALEGLMSLRELRTIGYGKTVWENKRKKEYWILTDKALIEVRRLYKLDPGRGQELKTEGEKGKRPTHLDIQFCPLWVDQIDSFYVLKPVAFWDELKHVVGSNRIPQAIPLLLDWLPTKNTMTVKIGRELLAERLRLSSFLDSRHQTRLDERLQEAIDVALQMGYLLDYRQDAMGMYTFSLNPERCKRIKRQPELEPEPGEEGA